MKYRFLIYLLIFSGFILMLTFSCKKDEEKISNIIFNPNLTYGTLSDICGNKYKTITIGTQTWMAENLKTTKYSNGVSLTNITKANEWGTLISGVWCYYNNDKKNNLNYGKLYNWCSVNNSNGLCPNGWHVPTDSEWTILSTYLGGESIVGDKLKETGIIHWQGPNEGATNESGFTALPAGFRNSDGVFDIIGNIGYWWTSTEGNTTTAYNRIIEYDKSNLGRNYESKAFGFAVRCIKD